jgi:hypothetical protein
MHLRDSFVLFRDITLVDAYCICPQQALRVLVTQLFQGEFESFGHQQTLADIDAYRPQIVDMAPSIGMGFKSGSPIQGHHNDVALNSISDYLCWFQSDKAYLIALVT